MKLLKQCTEPKNQRNWFIFLGTVKFNTADVLASSAAVPD